MLQIYFRTRIRWSITCLACLSVTATRPCPPRTRHHCRRRPHCGHRRSDHEDGFTKLLCYSFGSQHSCTCTRQHSCVFVLSGWIPKLVREHAVANPRWVKDATDTTTAHRFCNKVHLQFHCIGSRLGARSITEPASLSGREDRFRHPCWRIEVSVSMSSCCSSHKQIESSTYMGAVSAHETAQLLVTHISAVHCLRGQVFTHVANLNFSFVPSHGSFRGCVNARCLFILALSTFRGTDGFPLFCTSIGLHPGSSRLKFSFASGWQRVLRNRHRNRKMMKRSSSRCI